MDLYTKLIRTTLLPLGEKLLKRNLSHEYKEALKTEWLSKEELYNLQCNKLQQLIKHCYSNGPYYTSLFDSLGLKPESIKCREDLEKIPVLTKEDIRNNFDKLISTDISARRHINGSTGGSTGTPMKFIADVNTWTRLRAANFRMWHSAGYEFGEKMFTLAGNSLVKKIGNERHISPKDIYDIVIMRNKKHDCTDISSQAMAGHYKALMNYKPKVIRGYASSLYFLARYIEQNNLPVSPVCAVFTTGEKLHSRYRRKLQKVFHAPVFDGYGAADGGLGAHECPLHEGLHVSEENCVVEITDDKGKNLPDGQTGHVITTDLNNFAFPFIRYKVGDLAYFKEDLCSCGRGSRVLGEVIGREGRAVYNKEGRPYSSIVIDNMMFPNLDIHSAESCATYELIDKFQVRQDKNGDLDILIKKLDSGTDDETIYYVIENFKKHFPTSEINLRFVNDIPTLPSGKEDYCVSEFTKYS